MPFLKGEKTVSAAVDECTEEHGVVGAEGRSGGSRIAIQKF